MLVFFKHLINLTSFLFKSKFISFPICDSVHLLSHYYYYYNYYFYYYFLLFFFYMFRFAIISHFHCLVVPSIFNIIASIIILINCIISFSFLFSIFLFLLPLLFIYLFLYSFIHFSSWLTLIKLGFLRVVCYGGRVNLTRLHISRSTNLIWI